MIFRDLEKTADLVAEAVRRKSLTCCRMARSERGKTRLNGLKTRQNGKKSAPNLPVKRPEPTPEGEPHIVYRTKDAGGVREYVALLTGIYMMELQAWIEMRDRRRSTFDLDSWVPLRVDDTRLTGERWREGCQEEHVTAVSIALPVETREKALRIGWARAVPPHNNPWADSDTYHPAGIFTSEGLDIEGHYLVIAQYRDADRAYEWHLDQQIALALRLTREGDSWVCPDEDYEEVIRMERAQSNQPSRIEIRGEHLRDYLCARQMGLLLASFRSRRRVLSKRPPLSWQENRVKEEFANGSWEGSVHSIDEWGHSFGKKTLVLTASRHDRALEDAVPVLKRTSDQSFRSGSHMIPGGKSELTMVSGLMWRNEWLPPGPRSPRVRGDSAQSTASFIIDADGTTEVDTHLGAEIRWLWFSPNIINDVLRKRGGELGWYTGDTGAIGLASHSPLPFGVNEAGLVNVFAKDIGELPHHVQRLWAARNITPEGGVSAELRAAQMECSPARTIAPEAVLAKVTRELVEESRSRLGSPLLQPHSAEDALLRSIHRFQAIEPGGIFFLCKEITRFVSDRLDKSVLRRLCAPDGDKKLGSLKLLERGLSIAGADGRAIVKPLVGAYELRLADAHPPSSTLTASFRLLGIEGRSDTVEAGERVIRAVVSALLQIREVLVGWKQA